MKSQKGLSLLLLFILLSSLTIPVKAGAHWENGELIVPKLASTTWGSGRAAITKDYASLGVNDFFLTEAELPAPWIPGQTVYTPGAHMRVKEKLMGGVWASVFIQNTTLDKSIHVTIGYFPTEAEAIRFANPDTYIFRTDAYMETGQTLTELMQSQSQYSLAAGSVYGDGGFAGGYQHKEFQPFYVFRVGQVLFHTDATDSSTGGILEPLLVNKARLLLNMAVPTETGLPNITPSTPLAPTLTPQIQSNPIVLQASVNGEGAVTLTLANTSNYGNIIIDGTATDQAGNGVAGATIKVLSGASAISTQTNPDGSYSLVVTIPGGQGSGELHGANFTLQAGDLSIDRVVLLQAIEGGQLVTYRDVGVRVFVNWGLEKPVDVEVTVTVDNLVLPSIRGVAKKTYTQTDRNRGTDAINLVIPKDRFPSWGDSTHTLIATAKIVSPGILDPDTGNNTSAAQNFSLKNSQALNILYVSLDPGIGKPALVGFSAKAHSFLNMLYPIPYSWGFVGTQRVNYYLVSPYVNFMKSLDADDLPLNLGDIGIVEGSVEVGKLYTYQAAIIAVEKARRLYNSQRCIDPQGKLILPCPNEVALQAVGVYPDGAYGSSKDGFAYVDQRHEWRAAANSYAKPENVAHELGHLFGLGEEYSSTSTGVPINGSTWDGVNFRTADGSCINMMGNVGLACAWINAQTWNSLLADALRLNVPNSTTVASLDVTMPRFELLDAEVQSPALLVEGVVTSAGQGFISQVSTLARYTQTDHPGGQFTLEARDASGNILGTTQFDGLFLGQGANPVTASPYLVMLPVTDPAQVTQIIFFASPGQIAANILRSAAAPQVQFDPLPNVIPDQAVIAWQTSDADGGTLLSTLYYSNNGGITWHLLGVDMPVNNFTLDAAELPGGSAIFKVSVSDGFNTAESVSTPVNMPDQPPIITIVTPWGVAFDGQSMVSLEAVGYDMEDGLLPSPAIQWFDAQGTPLGTGTLLQIAAPDAGSEWITAKAHDSQGQLSEAKIEITITGAGPAINIPLSFLPTNALFLLGGGACVLLMLAGMLIGGVTLIFRGLRQPSNSMTAGYGKPIQDPQGTWWQQDSRSGRWQFWNGRVWQPAPGTAFNRSAPQWHAGKDSPSGGSCLLSTLISGVISLISIGAISLIALDYFPDYQIERGSGEITQILKTGGSGLLLALLGLLLINGGLKAIITRQTIVTDERGRRREKRGCSAILSGISQLFIGSICLAGGLGLITLTFYQQILPRLGF